MPLGLQAKLLRVLESRTVQRLGSTQSIPVNMRVIASAQCPLGEMVERGEFRRDLYFRLNIISLKLPPLRSRKERIVPLFQSLVRREAQALDRPYVAPSPALLRQLLGYAWPGNIRELQSAAKRYVLGLPALPRAEQLEHNSSTLKLKEHLQQFEKNPHRGLHAPPPSLHRQGHRRTGYRPAHAVLPDEVPANIDELSGIGGTVYTTVAT
nr:hypothetical protein GCM10020185_37910 [Pseudomonas brassicacearum subsp. brassicacearum]